MAIFIGKGILKEYSKVADLKRPLKANQLAEFLHLPRKYSENVIFVKGTQKMEDDEVVQDKDEIMFFLAVMGG